MCFCLRFRYLSYLFALVSYVLFCEHVEVKAQVFSNAPLGNRPGRNTGIVSDTSKKKLFKSDNRVLISSYTYRDTSRRSLDSAIQYLHRNPLLGIWQVDLGNFGSTYNSLKFNPIISPSLQLGIVSNQLLLYNHDSVRFYNTTRPYSAIYYRIGSQQEHIIRLLHTQNITPTWNMAVQYQKLGSQGFFKSQKTNNDNLAISTHYVSHNLRYDCKASFVYNKLLQHENGGILNENLLDSSIFSNRRLLPVLNDAATTQQNNSDVTNYYRNASVNLEHIYMMGKSDSVFAEDSTKVYHFKPVFGIKNNLYANFEYYKYKDLNPDSLHYTLFAARSISPRDSLQTRYKLGLLGSSLSLNGIVRIKGKPLQGEAGYGIELYTPRNGSMNNRDLTNYLFAHINKPLTSSGDWGYIARFRMYVLGSALGNSHILAQAQKQFRSSTMISLGLEQSIQQASYMSQFFESNYFEQSARFSKITITKANMYIALPKHKARLAVNYFLVTNWVYRDTTLQPKQYNKALPIIQTELHKQFRYKDWVSDNDILLQFASNKSPVHVPRWASRHRVGYENAILRKKLLVATGIELRYNSPYFADNYTAPLYAFTVQYNRQIANSPQLAYFFNFKIKRYRASISLDELQQLFTTNNINYSHYPAQNFGLRFGFEWVFVN